MTQTYTPLLTDLYQLTMAYGYWKLNIHERPAAFHLLFRRNPFKGNYTLSCGMGSVLDFLSKWHFQEDDLDYLSTLNNGNGDKLFANEFLDYLRQMTFTCSIDAIPEGTVVFPHEPLLRIQGPLLQCQLLESPLLNILNFQTLIATKASRVCRAAGSDTVIEFGLRRAQGPDGAVSASRASYIGGCHATSNTLAGKLFGIPVRGTHAHSWVTAFPTEKEAFAAYASIMPNNCTLLVDTYKTLDGVANAIEIGKELRQEGSELLGIRLDSGDMAELSIKARKMLDDAGFEDTTILASNSLDEYVISDLKQRGAKISAWGVGTNLTTAYDQPALDGVYKLSALQDASGAWDYKLKLSEQEIKVSNPGRHQVRRFFCNNRYVTDVIYDLALGIGESPEPVLFDPSMTMIRLNDYDAFVDLLEPVIETGKVVLKEKSIHDIRASAVSAVKQFKTAHSDEIYPVGLEAKLHEVKTKKIQSLR